MIKIYGKNIDYWRWLVLVCIHQSADVGSDDQRRLIKITGASMGQTRFASGRQLDVICLGRLGVDLYAQQVGARLEDVSSFAKYRADHRPTSPSARLAWGFGRQC
jgi:hypothetical protein